MNLEATITVSGDTSALREAIETEAREMGRSSIAVEQAGKALVLRVRAKDATALRASLSSVLKLLIVHEKMTSL
jgi:tRNA threonylcarbamoyladenosine modification (KEOPS) complex  Pcc1 subunit